MEGLDMKIIVIVLFGCVMAEIRDSVIMNKFVPLTEIPPPYVPHIHSGRRHLEAGDCTEKYVGHEVIEGGKLMIAGEDYLDGVVKTVATVIIPDHIDHMHFGVSTQVPYLTLGPIEGIGYHPTTKKGDHPPECEKIYQDHLDELYSDEDTDYSEESLEMARMPLFPANMPHNFSDTKLDDLYNDIDLDT
ncbi:3-dehydroquinate dehydratase [Operophtera brumata]|uniref:3-dehydroquinate dehydratase n=1 Tax=Operophtera brumata TaxID=104452 RepID=A0A0L7KZG7_OPEBR|nr:3-dehydroquinate dehydratase [Operophtera brumata]